MDVDEYEEQELKPRGLCGLTNIGNTCYMNSALQSLSNCPQLTRFFLKFDEFQTLQTDGKLTVAKCYKELMKEMWNKKRPKHLTPSTLMRAIRIHNPTFRGYSQQDTQEFLRCVMDRLHEELKCPIVEFPENQISESDSEDEDSVILKNKRLLGGNGSSDDSPVDMVVDEEQPNTLLFKQRSPSSSSKKQRSPSSSSKKQRTSSVKKQRTTSESQRKRNTSQLINESPKKELKYRSIITSVFDGKLLSSVQCLTCNRISNTVETFQDLSLPIPSKEDLNHMHTQAVLSCSSHIYNDAGWFSYLWDWMKSWFVGPDIQLEDCFAAFFTNDELKGDNMYNCEKCKKLRNGIKYSRVHSLPEVLCIHLKRFRHELYHSSKINTYISFPIHDLDLQPFLSKDCIQTKCSSKYDLTAIICHFGNVGGGHYIAYARNCINNKWYEFNDAFISEVSETTVTNAEAYVLFYSLKDHDADDFRKHINVQLNSSKNIRETKYISKEWLSRFDSCVQPGPVCNYDFVCKHGGISLQASVRIKSSVVAVSGSISNELLKRFGGGPEISSLGACHICQELEKRKQYELDTFTKFHQEFQEEENVKIAYKISMNWYDAWYAFVTGKKAENPGPINNADVNDADNANFSNEDSSYGCISESTWRFLHVQYGGGPEIIDRTVDSENEEDEKREEEEEDRKEEDKKELKSAL